VIIPTRSGAMNSCAFRGSDIDCFRPAVPSILLSLLLLLERLPRKNDNAPSVNIPIGTPTPMPALAPVDKPVVVVEDVGVNVACWT
jgi:hypothetical protein